jgi:hypothetical protein
MSYSRPCRATLDWRAWRVENRLASRPPRHQPRRFRRWLPVLMLIGLFAGTATAVLAQAEALEEYQVKAAFLYQFTKFIEWPAEAFPDANAPFSICVAGVDPFGNILNQLLQQKTVGQRRLELRRSTHKKDLQGCQILFISASERKRFPAILTKVKGSPVVTVSESDRFMQAGGAINFFLSEERVRFDINLGATEGTGLKVSSRLLSVARTVLKAQRGGD